MKRVVTHEVSVRRMSAIRPHPTLNRFLAFSLSSAARPLARCIEHIPRHNERDSFIRLLQRPPEKRDKCSPEMLRTTQTVCHRLPTVRIPCATFQSAGFLAVSRPRHAPRGRRPFELLVIFSVLVSFIFFTPAVRHFLTQLSFGRDKNSWERLFRARSVCPPPHPRNSRRRRLFLIKPTFAARLEP